MPSLDISGVPHDYNLTTARPNAATIVFVHGWLAHMPGLDWLFARANVAQPLARRWGKQRLVDFVTAAAQAALGSLLESTVEEEVHRLPQLVARLQQPVYFVAGRQDTLMEPQYVNHLASFHPLFRDSAQNVTELPSCGHLAMLEQTDLLANHVQMLVGELAYV